MAWYPDAVRRQLTVPRRAAPNDPVRMPHPVRINLHTAVSNSTSLAWTLGSDGKRRDGFFNTPGAGGVFSHFYIRQDGVVEQMQDTTFTAACDLDGNPDTISIESWDGARMQPWTPVQVAALEKLLRWLLAAHPSIPAKLATDNRRAGTTSHGISWHQLGVPYDGRPGYARYGREQGGLLYTTSRGKECPGRDRIGQIPAILRAAVGGPSPTPTSPEEDDIMAGITEAKLAEIVKAGTIAALETARWGEYVDEDGKGRDTRSAVDVLFATHAQAVMANRGVAALLAKAGIPADEIVAGLVEGLAPVLKAAVADVAPTLDPDALIDALAKRLGQGQAS